MIEWPDNRPIPEKLTISVQPAVMRVPQGAMYRVASLPLMRLTIEGPDHEVAPFATAVMGLFEEMAIASRPEVFEYQVGDVIYEWGVMRNGERVEFAKTAPESHSRPRW